MNEKMRLYSALFLLSFLGIYCSSPQRLKPPPDLNEEERLLFYKAHRLSIDEGSIFARKNFVFYESSILQGGQRLSNKRDTFRYYPELGQKYEREANIWQYSWLYGLGGLTYGTLGILGFTKAIDFAPFWNYFFSSIGAISLTISIYTFSAFTPDYESLVPQYNEALRKELFPNDTGNRTMIRFTYALN